MYVLHCLASLYSKDEFRYGHITPPEANMFVPSELLNFLSELLNTQYWDEAVNTTHGKMIELARWEDFHNFFLN